MSILKIHQTSSFIVSLALLLTFAECPKALTQTRVTTVAGGYVGDGANGTSAAIQEPQYAAIDSSGNLYVTDCLNHRIRKLATTGILTTVAGTGIAGFSGDGGPALSAKIYMPTGIVINSASEIIFSDSGNNRIRKINASGTISTIAGTGVSGFGGDGGAATAAKINKPFGLALTPAGNLFFADLNNQRIRKIDGSGKIHTVAGNGVAGFGGDGGPAISATLNNAKSVFADTSGDFYIADTLNLRVRKVDSTGTITTFAGNGLGGCTGDGGPATSARLGQLTALTIHSDNLLISNGGCDFTRKVNLTTNIITTIAGSLSSLGTGGFDGNGHRALSSVFSGPTGIVYDHSNNLLIVDTFNDQVRKVDATTHIVSALAGGYIGDGSPGTAVALNSPQDIAFDRTGNMYIADLFDNRVRKRSPEGTISTFAGTGVTGHTGDGGPATSATLSLPISVAADRSGDVFIADEFGSVLRRVNSSGIITTLVTQDANLFLTSMVTDASGNIYGADPSTCVVWRITPVAEITVVAGVPFACAYNSDGIPATTAYLSYPYGVAFDGSGNLYVGDAGNNRVRKVNTSGIISTYAGNGSCGFGGDGGPATSASLCDIAGVAFDSAGNLYISDTGNLRVRIVDTTGTIGTLAGTGKAGYNGNGLLANKTNLDLPLAVRVSPSGMVFVVDGVQYRVRRIH